MSELKERLHDGGPNHAGGGGPEDDFSIDEERYAIMKGHVGSTSLTRLSDEEAADGCPSSQHPHWGSPCFAVPPPAAGEATSQGPHWYKQKSLGRAIVGSMVGTALESYDFALYAACSGTVFGDVFFPPSLSQDTRTRLSFAAFAVGFITRPVGGLVFGHVGDRVGRKAATISSLMLAGAATAAMGLLPSYERIGVAAPVVLVLLRCLQGIGFGGEYGGAVLLSYEYGPEQHAALLSCPPQVGGTLGASLSFALLAALQSSKQQHHGMGWRVAFLLSLLLLVVGLYIRRRVEETPAFRSLTSAGHDGRSSRPLVSALSSRPRSVVLALGLTLFDGTYMNLLTAFALAYLSSASSLPHRPPPSLLSLPPALALLVCGACIPLWARLADRVGRRYVFSVGCVLSGMSTYWTFHLLQYGSVPWTYVAFVVPFGLIFSMVASTCPSLVVAIFPPHSRCSGIGFVYQLSRILGGGLAPTIASALLSSTSLNPGHQPWPVCHYAQALALLSAVCALLLPAAHFRDQLEHDQLLHHPAHNKHGSPGVGIMQEEDEDEAKSSSLTTRLN